jgi:hypothetical protein
MTTNMQNAPARYRWGTTAALLIASGAIAVGGLGAAAPASADVDRYVAIAYSPASGQWGYSAGGTDQQQGWGEAMGYCRNKGGTDCTIVVQAKNACVAVATAWQGKWGVGTGPDIVAAQQDARHNIAFATANPIAACSTGEERTVTA